MNCKAEMQDHREKEIQYVTQNQNLNQWRIIQSSGNK